MIFKKMSRIVLPLAASHFAHLAVRGETSGLCRFYLTGCARIRKTARFWGPAAGIGTSALLFFLHRKIFSQIHFSSQRRIENFLFGSLNHNLAGTDDDGARGNFQRVAHVVIGNQDADAAF